MKNIEITIDNDNGENELIREVEVFETVFGVGVTVKTNVRWCELFSSGVKTNADYVTGVKLIVGDAYDLKCRSEVLIRPNDMDSCADFDGVWFVSKYDYKIDILIVDMEKLDKESVMIKES